MDNTVDIPNAPKSKKISNGFYETNTQYGIVQVMKNEGTGLWQCIHKESGEWMQSWDTKSNALDSLKE